MGTNVPRVATMMRFLVLGVSLLGFTLMATSSLAAETGVLKLMVARCEGGEWIDNAQVDVIIYRPGVGPVDSDRGHTNSSGYVELTFTDLEISDEARTTVTPQGERSDTGHTYVWTAQLGDEYGGVWDLGSTADSPCSDGWYDLNHRIFECLYE